jgi:peroxiredoxin Q/BCP
LSLRESGDAIKSFDVAYFTASCDKAETNKEFAEDMDVDYPILSDPGLAVAKAFGVVKGRNKYAKRWTFFFGKDGKLLHIDKDVSFGSHGGDIAMKLAELKVAKKP